MCTSGHSWAQPQVVMTHALGLLPPISRAPQGKLESAEAQVSRDDYGYTLLQQHSQSRLSQSAALQRMSRPKISYVQIPQMTRLGLVPTTRSVHRSRQTCSNAHKSSGFSVDCTSMLQVLQGGVVSVPGHRRGPIMTDTRRDDICGAWFLALTGPFHDGHDYVLDCLDRNVAGVIVSKRWLSASPTSAALLHQAAIEHIGVVAVPDTLRALTQLCQHAMTCYEHTVVAITGSCGKTTCKSMVRLVSQAFTDGMLISYQVSFPLRCNCMYDASV